MRETFKCGSNSTDEWDLIYTLRNDDLPMISIYMDGEHNGQRVSISKEDYIKIRKILDVKFDLDQEKRRVIWTHNKNC